MTRPIPFNGRNHMITHRNADFGGIYSMLNGILSEAQTLNPFSDAFKIDIEERDDAYAIEAELPGVKKEDIELKMEEDIFSISVNRKEEEISEEEKSDKKFVHKERRFHSMSRSIRLADVNPEEIKASLEDGILTVTVPKAEKPNRTHTITIG